MKSLVFLFLFTKAICFAQTDTTLFRLTKPVEVAEYIFTVPEKWREIVVQTQSGKDRKFDFTGVGIPHEINKIPVTAIFTLRKFIRSTLRDATNYIVTEFTSYPDRITPKGCNYKQDTLQILSGQTANFFSTKYYRRTKNRNYSRYDIIAYSEKRKSCYMLTITYQYKDPTYNIETVANFEAYAVHIFKTLVLR